MKTVLTLASLALVTILPLTAEARDRWHFRYADPWQQHEPLFLEDEDDVALYEDEAAEEAERFYQQRKKRQLQRRLQRQMQADEAELWWLEDGARQKLEQRRKPANVKRATKPEKPAAKPVAKLTPKPVLKPVADPMQTASLSKPAKSDLAKPKPVAAAKSSKTIGCTAGAAVIVGYGFGEVKPKACTGQAYAYTASRSGKAYEITLAAASGEITGVRKLN
jgi:hypothetical protein